MSSQLRSDLGRTLGHARRHHGAYMEFKTNHPAPWTNLQKAQAETLMNRMKDDIKSFEKYFTKWISLVQRIQNDAEFDAESNLYNQWMDDYDGMICDLKDFCAEIESLMDVAVSRPRMDRTPEVVVSRSDVSLASTQVDEGSAIMDMAASQLAEVCTVRNTVASPQMHGAKVCETLPFYYGATSSLMPALNIARFSGDSIKWKAFWQRFDLNVHSRTYPKIQKMDILIGLLEGRALEEVEGFELSAENYDSVVQLLQERFGNNDLIINQLQANLRALKVAAQNSDSLRTTVNKINNMCRQLKNFGVDVENASLRLDIIDKMPPCEKGELKWLLVSAPGTTTEALLKKMNEFARKAEVLEQDRKGESESLSASSVPTSVKSHHSDNSSSEKFWCTYCDEDHKSALCTKFSTVEEKLKCLKDKHYCTKCASRNHEANACKLTLKCNYCNELHRAFLCPKRSSNFGDSNNQTRSYLFVEKKQGNLLTKQVTLINPETKKSMDVIALFDSGSQRSYASNQLIGQLKLQAANVEKLNVQGFGARGTVFNSKMIELRIKTFGGHMDVKVNSAKKIAGPVPVIESEGFGVDKIVITHRKPDLVIGMDYFFKIITSFEEHNENMVVVHSKVGKMFTGEQVQQKLAETLSSLTVDMSSTVKHRDKRKHLGSNVFSLDCEKRLIKTYDKAHCGKPTRSGEPTAKAYGPVHLVKRPKKKKLQENNRADQIVRDKCSVHNVSLVKPNVKEKRTLSKTATNDTQASNMSSNHGGGEGLYEKVTRSSSHHSKKSNWKSSTYKGKNLHQRDPSGTSFYIHPGESSNSKIHTRTLHSQLWKPAYTTKRISTRRVLNQPIEESTSTEPLPNSSHALFGRGGMSRRTANHFIHT